MDSSRSTVADALGAALSASADASAPVTSGWRASPLRARPGPCALAAAAILALGVLVGVAAQDVLWGALTALALVVCTLDAWIPVHYAADATGLRIHGALRSRRVRWTDVRSVAFERDGAFLVTARGGVTVLLDAPERGAWLRQHVQRARGDVHAEHGAHAEQAAPPPPSPRVEAGTS